MIEFLHKWQAWSIERFGTKNKTLYWAIALLALLLFLFFIPKAIMYSGFKITDWAVFGLIFGLLPYLVYNLVKSFDHIGLLATGFAALSVLVVGPCFGLYHGHKEKEDLKQKGVWTKAVVIDRKYLNSNHQHGWVIKCSFFANGENYNTAFVDDDENKFTLGDTLNLIYSKDFPRINELDYRWLKKSGSVELKKQNDSLAVKNALKFINAYVDNCKKMRQAIGVVEWVNSNSMTSKRFRSELNKLTEEAKLAEPESGLDADPIFDAQDYPDTGFELESFNKETNYVVVRGNDWKDFKLTMKMILEKGTWLVDGCGTINIPHNRRMKR